MLIKINNYYGLTYSTGKFVSNFSRYDFSSLFFVSSSITKSSKCKSSLAKSIFRVLVSKS